MANIQRRKTVTCSINGVRVGSDAPVVVQSMTNTDTSDIASTVQQVAALARAGSELVRVTVNNEDAAAAVAPIVEQLAGQGVHVPIVGDFHYNGHLLLKKYPDCARALAKYRINPGNVGIGRKDDSNFRTMIEVAVENQKPVRIGVNWGSLDQALLTRMMDENSRLSEPKDAREVTMEAMVVSALNSAALAEKYGLRPDQIILSAKVSGVQDLIDVYRSLAARCNYPLHLGLTEAGMGAKGVVASSAALGSLMGKLADKAGYRSVGAVQSFLLVVFFMIAVVSRSFTAICIGYVLYSIVNMTGAFMLVNMSVELCPSVSATDLTALGGTLLLPFVAVASPLAGTIIDRSGNYAAVFYVGATIAVVALFGFGFLVREPRTGKLYEFKQTALG